MSTAKRTMTVLATSAALLLGGTAAWAAYSWTHRTTVTVRSAAAVEPTVEVLGEVAGLLPGSAKPLQVTIGNGNDFPLRVTKISGGSSETASGCPAWAVRVNPAERTTVTIPRRSTKTVTIKVAMESWADQKCAGQSFALELTTITAVAA